MRVLCIDPGIRGSGAALFSSTGKQLVRAAYVKSPARAGNGPAECLSMAHAIKAWCVFYGVDCSPERLVVEWPRVYTTSKMQGDPNDLLGLVGVDCALAGLLCVPVERYFPDEWKGQAPKEVMNERVKLRLSADELARIDAPASLLHNVLDAVGIGLHYLGRLQRTRVFPGATR